MGDGVIEYKETVLSSVKLSSKYVFQIYPEKSKVVSRQEFSSNKMAICMSETKQEGILKSLTGLKITKIIKVRNQVRLIGKCEAKLPGI